MIRTYGNAGKFSPCPTHYSQNYRRPPRFVRSTASGCRQLRRSHFHIPHSFQFLIGQFQTSIHIFNIRPEVDAESTCIGIRSQIGFDIINQSPAFTKRNIQFAVHSRTAEDIIQQIECGTFVVVCIISTATNHYMCLMCVFSYR